MLKLNHNKLIILSGIFWFVIGTYLLRLGLVLLMGSVKPSNLPDYPLISSLEFYLGTPQAAALLLIMVALLIGYIKGRYVLGKSARRGVMRILQFPNPTSLLNIYSGKYYLLLASMIALGISIKYLGLSDDFRGFVDVAIGSALINGAMIYFKYSKEGKVCSP